MSTLNSFVTRFAAPVLRAAGFERRRTEFCLPSGRGAFGLVGFYPDPYQNGAGFEVQFGGTLQAYLDWREDRGLGRPPFPSTSEAVLRQAVPHPDYGPDQPYSIFVNRWAVDLVQSEEETGRNVERALRDLVVPEVCEWLDPCQLARASRERVPGRSGLGPIAARVVFALVDQGPSRELDVAIAELPDDDTLGEWALRRLQRKQRESDDAS